MSRLINTTTMTVDGVTDVGEWYVAEGGHDRAARDQFDGAAGMMLGRTTYEGLAAFWSQQTGEWAELLNPLPKLVASRTLHGLLEWNATLIEGAVAEGVSRLKAELDGDLLLIGCGELARHLLANGLVDELRFWLHPAAWGEGAQPYQGETVRMRLLDSTSTRASRSCATSRLDGRAPTDGRSGGSLLEPSEYDRGPRVWKRCDSRN